MRSCMAGAQTIDDIRRDVRLGMGPCQGGFCTFRAAGILHELQSQQGIKSMSRQPTMPYEISCRNAGKAYCPSYGGSSCARSGWMS